MDGIVRGVIFSFRLFFDLFAVCHGDFGDDTAVTNCALFAYRTEWKARVVIVVVLEVDMVVFMIVSEM